ncbi:MAG TPA: glycosyltransferase family 39 protein [Anaerolineae bacterium]|nr:glycosyltransferase family 39 protein [Anaerolineae bacterium]HMR67358.1 glycosyltransferase family 39 protein [Anaerolineae bacterium]
MSSTISRMTIRRYGLALLILWLAFGLRLYRLEAQSIWWDEGHSLFVAGHSLTDIPTLPAMDVHPPAYFALLHLWIALTGQSEFTLRYLSVIFSLLTLALLWRFAASLQTAANRPRSNEQLTMNKEQLTKPPLHPSVPPSLQPCNPSTSLRTGFPTVHPSPLPSFHPSPALLTTLFAALSPMYVAYAQEVRSYALVTFLALASTYLQWRLLFAGRRLDSPPKQGAWLILYTVATAASLYTHYFTLFLLLFQNLIWLLWLLRGHFKRGYPLKTTLAHAGLWLASQIGILLLFMPQILLAWRQVSSYANPNLSPPPLLDFLSRSWQAYTVGLTLDPEPARWGMGLIFAGLALGWLIHCLSAPRRYAWPFALLSLWLMEPLLAYFIVLQRQPSFEPRYLMLVTPALFLLLGLGLSGNVGGNRQNAPDQIALSRPRSHVPGPSLALLRLPLIIIVTAVLIVGLNHYFTNPAYFKDDSAGVAAWLAEKTRANDLVLVDVPHPFHYYAQDIPAPTHYLFVDIHTAAETLNREAASRDRLFWVTWRGSDTDPRGVIPFLAEKAGRWAGSRDFRGYHVAWYDLPAEAHFSLPDQLTPAQATFGEALRLDGYAFSPTVGPNEPVWATLHFTLLRETQTNYKVSLRLRDEAGSQIAQIDRDLLNDRHVRTAAWSVDDPALNQAINVYLLPLPLDTPPGRYRLEVVVYNAEPPYPSEGLSRHPSDDGIGAILGYIMVD